MPNGIVTINNVVPYLGELFQMNKRPNALLRLLGGIQGGVQETTAKEFPIGAFWNIPAPAQPAILEGANAPTPAYRSLTQSTNVIQIFQEAITITYLAQSDHTVAGIVPIPQGAAQGGVQNPRSSEFQVMTTLQKVAQDANYSMLNGTFVNPADPASTALKTRGLLTAITTNSIDKSADTGVTTTMYRGYVNLLMQTVITANGYGVDETWTLLAGTTEYSNICAAYEAQGTIYLQPESEYAGIKVRKILTRFGSINLVLEPDMPAQYFAICNLGVAGIVGLPVPNKGILFEEQLFKQGSADQTQLYGQLGIDHGPEYCHGKLKVPASVAL
ncbi:hypothetical protein CCAX7_000450 [Capsulimonas corticalis]|uniref:Uncharacterized protein n=1 Tax=Capsulimonas corticalis TaxID=2219043 RepID=A0A402CR60_9BACT|nr:DUF5309 family protein [Capsulimonas corticalis]BDI27994.1 hypothetical protein CCAX7_000450 [Capsulimonas corticalis]